MDELRVKIAAHEATMAAVQETLHRIDRTLDKIGNSTEHMAASLAVQSARADGQDLRFLSFRESFDMHLRDDVEAFRRIDDKFEELTTDLKTETKEQTREILKRLDALDSFRSKWQGATVLVVVVVGWMVTLWKSLNHSW